MFDNNQDQKIAFKQLESIRDLINSIEKEIHEQIKHYQDDSKIIIIIGLTGCGKSSIGSYLLGRELIINKGLGGKVQLVGEGIRSGCASETLIPSIHFNNDSKIVICDCPGFYDTGGHKSDIINSFLIDSLLSKSEIHNRIKILLVLSSYEITSCRGKTFFNLFERISNMLPNLNQLKDSIGFVITKGEDYIDYVDYIKDMSYYYNNELIQFLCKNPDHVFNMPRPSRAKIGQKYEFNDYSRLIRFIKNETIIQNGPLIHKIFLSTEESHYLTSLQKVVHDQIEQTINNLFKFISKKYKNENDEDVLKGWLNVFNHLKKHQINNSKDLLIFFQSSVKDSFQYQVFFDNLNKYENLISFFSKVNENENFSVLQKCLIFNIEKSTIEIENLIENMHLLCEQIIKDIQLRCLMEQQMIEARKIREKQERIQRDIENRRRQYEENQLKMKLLKEIDYNNQIQIHHLNSEGECNIA